MFVISRMDFCSAKIVAVHLPPCSAFDISDTRPCHPALKLKICSVKAYHGDSRGIYCETRGETLRGFSTLDHYRRKKFVRRAQCEANGSDLLHKRLEDRYTCYKLARRATYEQLCELAGMTVCDSRARSRIRVNHRQS